MLIQAFVLMTSKIHNGAKHKKAVSTISANLGLLAPLSLFRKPKKACSGKAKLKASQKL